MPSFDYEYEDKILIYLERFGLNNILKASGSALLWVIIFGNFDLFKVVWKVRKRYQKEDLLKINLLFAAALFGRSPEILQFLLKKRVKYTTGWIDV